MICQRKMNLHDFCLFITVGGGDGSSDAICQHSKESVLKIFFPFVVLLMQYTLTQNSTDMHDFVVVVVNAVTVAVVLVSVAVVVFVGVLCQALSYFLFL